MLILLLKVIMIKLLLSVILINKFRSLIIWILIFRRTKFEYKFKKCLINSSLNTFKTTKSRCLINLMHFVTFIWRIEYLKSSFIESKPFKNKSGTDITLIRDIFYQRNVKKKLTSLKVGIIFETKVY